MEHAGCSRILLCPGPRLTAAAQSSPDMMPHGVDSTTIKQPVGIVHRDE